MTEKLCEFASLILNEAGELRSKVAVTEGPQWNRWECVFESLREF